MSSSSTSGAGGSISLVTFILWYGSEPVPAGMRWPRTFLEAGEVVGGHEATGEHGGFWKEAPDKNDSDCSEAFVMPSNNVWPEARLQRLVLAGSLPSASMGVAFFEGLLVDQFACAVAGVAGLNHAELAVHVIVARTKTQRSTTSSGSNVVSPGFWIRILLIDARSLRCACQRWARERDTFWTSQAVS